MMVFLLAILFAVVSVAGGLLSVAALQRANTRRLAANAPRLEIHPLAGDFNALDDGAIEGTVRHG